jgi:serine phosphatase RsbU (regulator of sigma subunit)
MKNKTDVLVEASTMLAEPGRDTKRKILTAVNAVFIGAILLHLTIQLINTGTLPDPARDMLLFPLILVLNGFSLVYNLLVLYQKREPTKQLDNWTAWSSIIVAMLLAIIVVHINENTAVSMLLDFGFSVVLLFIVGTVLGRKVAVFWFFISAVSLFLAYQNVGTSFEYHLLTQEEINQFNNELKNKVPEAVERVEFLKENKLKPFPATLYVSIWFIYIFIAFLAVFFESNMISRVLDVIPGVVEKINIASAEKNKLENDNIRMGMELDVARKIQKMMLPKDYEFAQSKDLLIAARMDPASEVGGDFYEFLPQDDGSVVLAIGDVTDHGLQSGIVMLMAQSTIRTITDGQQTNLIQAMNRVNTVLYRNIRNRLDDKRNLTLSIAKIQDNHLTVCGQHENILYYNATNDTVDIISTADLGIYVGLIEDISEYLTEITLKFNSGDVYMFYTDGLTEAENEKGEYYGEDRMLEKFKEAASLAPDTLIDAIYKDVYAFMGNKEILDDITVMIVKNIAT